MIERAIRAGDVLVNPLVPEGARLLSAAYDFFDGHPVPRGDGSTVDMTRRWPPWDGLDGWDHVALGWRNLQLLVASRTVRPEEMGYGGSLRAIVTGVSPRVVYCVIPGTNEIGDWGAGNLNPWPVSVGGLPGRWRRGFALGGEWAWNELERRLGPEDRFVIVGHSFGGGVALTAAAHALRDEQHHRCLGVLAFAAPRVGSRRAAAALDRGFGGGVGQRYVLGFDVVPWSVAPLGWRHALEPVFVGSDGRVSSEVRWWRELRSAVTSPGVQAVEHHAMGGYLSWASRLPDPETVGAGKKTPDRDKRSPAGR